MIRRSVLWIVFVIALIVALYVFVFARVGVTEQSVLPETELHFSTGQKLIVEVADELDEQIPGLSNRDRLEEGHGMIFVYQDQAERLFWMKDMRFAIDIVWISDGEVVGIEHRVPPPTDAEVTPTIYSSPDSVDLVLEVPAGYMEKQGIGIGAFITIKDAGE